jgi:uncharacterized protein (DUF2461 family)
MSLPSRIEFIKDSTILGDAFVNVGWWISADGLEREIREAAKDNKELWNKCDRVRLYNLTFSKDFILSHKSIDECVKSIDELIKKV